MKRLPAAALTALVDAHYAEPGAMPAAVELDAETTEALRALGYLEGSWQRLLA